MRKQRERANRKQTKEEETREKIRGNKRKRIRGT